MNKLPNPAETKTFEHTLSGLVAQRAITAGKIEHAQAALRKLVQSWTRWTRQSESLIPKPTFKR